MEVGCEGEGWMEFYHGEISGSQGNEYEDGRHLGFCAV
jgi:hypothetical protein